MTMCVVLTLPIRTVSESNSRDHWSVRHRRAQKQRGLARVIVQSAIPRVERRECAQGMIQILLTRIAPRVLDTDNLTSALKAVRDGVADAYGVSDKPSGHIRWAYAQRKGKTAVEVEITGRGHTTGGGSEELRKERTP